MPADHLTPEHRNAPAGDQQLDATTDHTGTPTALESAVLALLAGTAPSAVATQASIPVADLIDAAERYQAAGRAALATPAAADWHQVHIQFPTRHGAEHTAVTELGPALQDTQTSGTVSTWWYVRKHPYWRLRFHTEPAQHQPLRRFLTDLLDQLMARALITTWSPGIYEPETGAFGGPQGMDIAHRFFHTDSVNILAHLHRLNHPRPPHPAPLGRRELSMLLCAALMRGAGQDWHEQGDIWHRVQQLRPGPPQLPRDHLTTITGKVHRLLALDTEHTTHAADPLAPARPWLDVARETGRALSQLARSGTLHRGLRDVLAHHVIFHWNRLGLTDTDQATLAHTAVATTLNTAGDSPPALRAPTDVART